MPAGGERLSSARGQRSEAITSPPTETYGLPIQPSGPITRTRPSRGRTPPTKPRGRRSARGLAASLTISALWHLLVLAILGLAVHPFELPDQERAVSVEILPPLVPPPTATVEIELRPRSAESEPVPVPQALPRAQAQDRAVEKPVEVQRQQALPKQLQTQRPPTLDLAQPQEAERAPPPPASVELARPAPSALPQPLEVQRRAAPAPRSIDANRPAPSIAPVETPAAPAQAEAPPAPGSVQALTNEQVLAAPVEIRPRERAPGGAPRSTTAPALPQLPPPGGAPAAPGGAAGGAQGDGWQYNGGALGDTAKGGLRMRLGCASPDTYKLSAEERAECLRRLAAEGRAAADLGINIPAGKQADYDRNAACRNALRAQVVPWNNSASEGTSVAGLGANPSLRQCGPGDR